VIATENIVKMFRSAYEGYYWSNGDLLNKVFWLKKDETDLDYFRNFVADTVWVQTMLAAVLGCDPVKWLNCQDGLTRIVLKPMASRDLLEARNIIINRNKSLSDDMKDADISNWKVPLEGMSAEIAMRTQTRLSDETGT